MIYLRVKLVHCSHPKCIWFSSFSHNTICENYPGSYLDFEDQKSSSIHLRS